VAYEGTRWYSRVGPHMLRSVGLGELVAENESQYVELAVRLIHDDAYRLACQQRLQQADLDATIFDTSDAQAFRRAVDFLIANHERLQRDPDRSPIHIT
jgi:predicted O-linked N-acetylglucosamine transferase (SPINDLY family)